MRGVPKWFNTIEDVENSMEVDKDAMPNSSAMLRTVSFGSALSRNRFSRSVTFSMRP